MYLIHEYDHERVVELYLNFLKKQTKYKNYKICHDIMISYEEATVKILEGLA